MDQINNTLNQCININNAYKIKHEELKMIYKAYEELYNKTNNEYLLENIINAYENILKLNLSRKVIIPKEKFYQMLKTQSKIMCEVRYINKELSKEYPNF